MKTLINIWNPTTGNEVVTLNELRDRIKTRRIAALNPPCKKEFQKKITVHDYDKSLQQVAAHYPSFKISSMNAEKAIEVFNAGGCQVAKIIEQ